MYIQSPCSDLKDFKFPIRKDTYEISPGLTPVSGNFYVFDKNYEHYIRQKKQTRLEDISKYFCFLNEFENEINICAKIILDKLLLECPQKFKLNKNELVINSEKFKVDDKFKLLENDNYKNTFDLICSNVQEDIAITKVDSNQDKSIAIHLSFPNHWNPNSKIGKSFYDIHTPVADFEPINKITDQILNLMINKGPFERYAWGLSTDSRLNHHPISPIQIKQEVWNGRDFDSTNPQLFMRIERQTILGVPSISSSIFTIRTFFIDVNTITQSQRKALILAIESMSKSTLKYKGIAHNKDQIIKYLKSLI